MEVRPEALAGDALVHSRGGGRPVERHEHDDLVPALYIGFVFLIATAAILAIQQLSETSDSLARYRVLARSAATAV